MRRRLTLPDDLDRLFQRAFGDAEPENWGTGWISGTLSVFLGALGYRPPAPEAWGLAPSPRIISITGKKAA